MLMGFPGGSVGKETAYNAGDTGDVGSDPRLGRSPGGEHDKPLQYSCLVHDGPLSSNPAST